MLAFNLLDCLVEFVELAGNHLVGGLRVDGFKLTADCGPRLAIDLGSVLRCVFRQVIDRLPDDCYKIRHGLPWFDATKRSERAFALT